MRLHLGLFVAGLVLAASACGSEEDGPLVGEPSKTVGTLSAESRGEAVVRDVTLFRETIDASGEGQALEGVYAVLNRANEAEVSEGAEMLRAEVPPLVESYESGYERARADIRSLDFESETAEVFRLLVLDLHKANLTLLRDFREELTTNPLAWEAALHFGEANNAGGERFGRRLEKALAQMPENEQAAVNQALEELFGTDAAD